MPKRKRSHPFVMRMGRRFHELRKERRLSLHALAGSKGYISQFERGQALPSLVTLDAMADRMGLDIIDLVNFPERGTRNALIEMTRGMDDRELKKVLKQARSLLDK